MGDLWLPKDERKLLRIYYRVVDDFCPMEEKNYSMAELVKVFQANDFDKAAISLLKDVETPSNECEKKDGCEEYKKFLKSKSKIDATNAALVERKLIKLIPSTPELHFSVNLTLQGYDLGRKYSDWFIRSGLWFAEYKNHWIMLILSIFGGVLGGALVAIIAEWIKRGNR